MPFRAPGPPKLCRNECGRACNVQHSYRESGVCCVRCKLTGTAEHSEKCGTGTTEHSDMPNSDRHDDGQDDDETDTTLFIPHPPQLDIPPPGFAGGSRDYGGAQLNTPPPGFAGGSRDHGGVRGGFQLDAHDEPTPDDPPAAWAGGTPPRRTHVTRDADPSASGEGVADLSSIRNITAGLGAPIRTEGGGAAYALRFFCSTPGCERTTSSPSAPGGGERPDWCCLPCVDTGGRQHSEQCDAEAAQHAALGVSPHPHNPLRRSPGISPAVAAPSTSTPPT